MKVPAMHGFAIANIALTTLVVGYCAAAGPDEDEMAIGALVLVALCNIILAVLVLI